MSNADAEILQPQDAPIILAIETATRAGSVAVSRAEQILASTTGDASSSHSTDLIENVDSILRASGLELRDVDLFAAAIGPGSFTGLRIGLATVKSLAVATNKKCIGVSTLAAVAHAAGNSERTVALLPAGRGEVFAQMLSVAADQVTPLDEACTSIPRRCCRSMAATTRSPGRVKEHTRNLNCYAPRPSSGQFRLTLLETATAGQFAPNNAKLGESVARLALTEYRAGQIY
jgi:tRNA threonylcarbamoyl adenosine modification protein YeaZ